MSLHRSNTIQSSSSVEQNSNQAQHYLQKAVKAIKELTLVQKSYKGLQSEIKIKKLIEINKYLEIASRKDPQCISVLVQNKLLIYIKHFFIQSITKAPALSFLRLLIPSQINSDLYLSHNFPILIVRVLQRDDNKIKGADWQQEATEALKLIASWLQHLPQGFPKLLATSLISFAQLPALSTFEQRKKDHISQHLKILAIDVILELTIKKLDLCMQIGAFNLLINSIIDPIMQERSQDILIRIIYFLNEEATRNKVLPYINLNKLFTIFTDLDYVFIQENSKNKGNIQYISKLQNQLFLSKNAFLTLLKSWTGIIVLANDELIISTIFQALKQIPKKQDSEVRKMIYLLLQEILGIGQSLLSSKSLQYQHQFQATSLLSSYMIALLRLLMNHQLFKLLIQLSGIDQPNIAEPAQKLLKKLSIYIFNFFPDAANYMDFLITAGTKNGPQSAVLKHSSSFIVSKIGNYVFDDQKQLKTSFLSEIQYIFNIDSIFTPLSRTSVIQISKTLNQLAYKEIPHYRRKLLDMKPIPKQHKENFKQWDWNAIIDLLSFPDIQKEGTKPDSSDKYKEYKLFKYLLKFYSYSGGTFAELKWTTDNFIYIKTGKLLILNILTIPDNLALIKNPPESQFLVTISFIGDLQKLLQNSLKSCSANSIKYDSKFFKTLQRQSILWIGSFSRTKVGYETLICQNHFFQIIDDYIHKKQCCYIISSLLFFFDFYRESLIKRFVVQGQQKMITIGPKPLLIKCVKEGPKNLKLMCIQVIKLLYKTQLTGFNSDGLKLLLSLVLENNEQLSSNAVQTIEVLIRDKNLLQSFLTILIEVELQNKQKFRLIKQKLSSHIFIRLSGLVQGYKFVTQKHPGWLETEYDKWFQPEESKAYFDHLQNLLNNTLNYNIKQYKGYKIETQGKDYIQWSFLYKLPWLLYINEGQQVPLLAKLTNERLILYNEFIDEQYDFRSLNSDNIMRICLGLGSMFLDEDLNPTKIKYFNSINLNNNNLVTLYGEKYYCSSMNGISVYFLLKPQGESVQDMSDIQSYANSYDIKRIHIEIKFSQYFTNQGLPLHLIQQITNTSLGMEFLKEKKLIYKSKAILQSSQSSTSEIRTVLWSLGYYGSTKEGMNDLIQEEILDKILYLSQNSTTLSLRGTCRYVLNMFCHSQAGRHYLTTKNNFINKKFLSCFPNNFKDICGLTCNEGNYQKLDLWSQCVKSLVKLNQNEQKIFDNITLFINSLSSKQAIAQIRDLLKSTVKVSWSFPLLQNVINLMSMFKMKYQARKTIHFIFDQFIKSNEFVNQLNKINYIC